MQPVSLLISSALRHPHSPPIGLTDLVFILNTVLPPPVRGAERLADSATLSSWIT